MLSALFLLTCAWPQESDAKVDPVTTPPAERQEPAKGVRRRQRDQVQGAQTDKKQNQTDTAEVRQRKAAKWWEGMGQEERRQVRERWQRYRDLPDESKAEMRRRMEIVKAETSQMLKDLPDTARARLEAMPALERRRAIHNMVRKRMAERHPELCPGAEGVPPPGRPDFRDQPLLKRLGDSGKEVNQYRRKRMERELRAAVKDGWLTDRAARHMMRLPHDQVARDLGRIRQWRLIDKFEQDGIWEKLKIGPEERIRFESMEPDEFIRRVWAIPGMDAFMPRHRGHSEGRKGVKEGRRSDDRKGAQGGRRPEGRRPGPKDGHRLPRRGSGPPPR